MKDFIFTDDLGREYLVHRWTDGHWWLFYKHADGQWVSLRKVTEYELEQFAEMGQVVPTP